jgi:hypothetical protein
MKMRHDNDATTLIKPSKARPIVGIALALAIAAGAATAATPIETGKMLHDCCAWHRAPAQAIR